MLKLQKEVFKINRQISPVFLVLILTLFLIVESAYSHRVYTESTRKDLDVPNAEVAKESMAKSLDLRIASKAIYPGGTLQKIKDLGIENGSHMFIVSFPVPNDNLKEYGLMSVPLTPKPANGYPLVILNHGYVNPGKYVTTRFYVQDMQFYSNHGYVVIKPDFRGQGLSEDSGRPEGAYYSMAYNTDLMNLLSSARQNSLIDKNNISLWGHSMGAYIALRAAVMSPDIKNIILLSGPVGAAKDMYGPFIAPSDRLNPAAMGIREKILLAHGSSLVNPNYWYNVSPLNYLKNSQSFIQIYVGSADTTVPPRFSRALDVALTAIGKNHFYRVFPGGEHGLVGERPGIWEQSFRLMKNGSQAS